MLPSAHCPHPGYSVSVCLPACRSVRLRVCAHTPSSRIARELAHSQIYARTLAPRRRFGRRQASRAGW
eukprot:scaffold50226_cov65-Phaeocystis_antarctica.AAC.1